MIMLMVLIFVIAVPRLLGYDERLVDASRKF